jgi:CHAT domain-containing protein/tetratricopeptide (TPR) repeat protein
MSFQFAKNLLIFSLLILLPQFIFAQTPEEPPINLEYNKPIERELSFGKIHEYQISLSANQYSKITIEQKGLDISGKLLDMDRTVLVQADVIKTLQGIETIETVAKTTGIYRLQINIRDLRKDGKYEVRQVELRDASKKDIAVDDARRLFTQANSLWLKRKCSEALPIVSKSIEIFERELGANDKLVGKSLQLQGLQYYCQGDYEKAKATYLRSLKIYEDVVGKNDNQITLILQELGSTFRVLGDYLKAEEVYRRMLDIREKQLDPNHGFIADTLTSLGNLVADRGDNEKAATYLKRALEIRENIYGINHQYVAESLVNLGETSYKISFSEPLYMRALAIREKLFGKESVQVGRVSYSLAMLYSKNAEYTKAESFAKNSLAIFEKTLGLAHPVTSVTQNLLGLIYVSGAKYVEAENIYQKAIETKEKTLGLYHPELGGTLRNLANVFALENILTKAVETQKRSVDIVELNISANLSTGSEREKIAYLETFSTLLSDSYTLHFQYTPNSQDSMNLAASVLFRQKGRVLDVISNQTEVLRKHLNEEDASLFYSLDDKNKQISDLILAGVGKMRLDEYKVKIQNLTDEREKLEGEISRRASVFIEKSNPLKVADIQSVIPNNTALLEFGVYKPVPLSESENIAEREKVKSHYIVFVLHKNGVVKSKDLGECKVINDVVTKFREALQDPKRTDTKQLAGELDKKVMSPIRAFLGDSKQLLVSPDGDLNLIPFEALVDESGKYLVEKYSISYLSSGRDLLRMQNSKPNSNSPLIIANPDFGVLETIENSKNQLTVKRSKKNKKRGVTVAESLSATYFAPLSGTDQEGRNIQSLFPNSTLLTGSKATKDALKEAKSPNILHIATHGFYLEKKEKDDSANALLRSGIALAGANIHTGSNGILTALEATGLNLFGTKLVVLSACGTGLGEVQSGEGVFGLRRSFVLAGSESLVISLWSVSDYITRELMANYYKNLKQGIGRGESLRQVQLEMLKNPKRNHPFYWASFIQSGEWANLEGKR